MGCMRAPPAPNAQHASQFGVLSCALTRTSLAACVGQAVSTWCHFKVSAAVKLGACASHSGLDFRWEGCSIEEDDDTPVGSFMKDGDSMVLTRLEDLGQEPHANAPPASCATGTAPAPATRRRTAGRGVPRHPETAAAAEPATGQQQRSSKRASSVPRLSRPASRTSSVGEPSCASASYAPVQHIPWHGQIRRGSSDGGAQVDITVTIVRVCKFALCWVPLAPSASNESWA